LVVVLAGGNDLFMNLAAVNAGTPVATAVTAMGTAGAELAGYIKTLVLAKGAKYVLVVTLPDVSKTPFAYAQSVPTQGLIQTMSKTFNDQLTAGLAGVAGVAIADGYGRGQDTAARPSAYGITNGTGTACDLSKATLGSLGCSAATLVSGDVSHYAFADAVHPTPYGHQLYADLAMEALAKAGWVD
jgi:phospholipase/lecithinase/hemolysin